MNSFYQLFLANLKMFYREKEGFYWTVLMPAAIYIALSVIPIGRIVNSAANYSSFVLPGIIAMTIMQGGIYSLAYWMVDLKARGIIKRLLATPLKAVAIGLKPGLRALSDSDRAGNYFNPARRFWFFTRNLPRIALREIIRGLLATFFLF